MTVDPTPTEPMAQQDEPATASRGRRWQVATLAWLRRRWPLATAALMILLITAWVLARRTGDARVSAAPAAPPASVGADTLLRLDTSAVRLAGVQLLVLTPSTSGTLVANGTITYDANRVSVVSPRVEGRLISVRADLGDVVSAGSVLALMESPDIGQTRGDLERASANLAAAQRNYDREKRLYEQQITPQKEMLEAENAFRTSQADYNSARTKLAALGAESGSGSSFGLATPIAGTIVERNASPGQIVGRSVNVFTVADLRHVWITVDVYEGDFIRVRRGAEAEIVPTAMPAEKFSGRVTYAGGIVDPASHTFKVRVEVENESLRLRPGMFAQVRIRTAPSTPGTEAGPIVVPEIAVQDVNGKPVVFVATLTPGLFVVRPVTVGARAGSGMVTVVSGLISGQQIVVNGAFQLKAELMKASFAEPE